MELFSEEECDRIVSTFNPEGWRPASVSDEDYGSGTVRPDIRSVLQQQLRLDSSNWPVSALAAAVGEINDRVFHFDVYGFDALDYPAALRYESEVEDHFRRHADSGASFPNRKLSCVVQLTPGDSYRGGDLVFPDAGVIAPRVQGTLIVFPSFLHHQVTPVVSGVRHVIVGWAGGPTFR
ncbi:MAG: 2OG-Fe(II) oxygenase [Microthrixaceae bacterium]|nr:2OG-Fe(II) oxygenase [Microthrixaceae bacterium]